MPGLTGTLGLVPMVSSKVHQNTEQMVLFFFSPSYYLYRTTWEAFSVGKEHSGSPGLFCLGLWGFDPGDAFRMLCHQSAHPGSGSCFPDGPLGHVGSKHTPYWEEKSGLLALSRHLYHRMKIFYSCFVRIYL